VTRSTVHDAPATTEPDAADADAIEAGRGTATTPRHQSGVTGRRRARPDAPAGTPGLAQLALTWLRSHLGIAVLSAALLGLMEVWGKQANGYLAGWGDHFVLSPEGLSWAIPGAFENDWFMESSPQPHWFFDSVTYLGQVTGHLSSFYAVFWGVGLLAFGAATALMAVKVAPKAALAVAVGFTLLTSQTPWMIGGTGSLVIPQALPAVASGSLVYLTLAALVTGHRRIAAAVAVLTAVVHVQQGAVVVIILVAFTLTDVLRTRRVDRVLAGSIVGAVAIVVFGLVLRPVASNLDDFVEICDTVIPYHCAAHLWSAGEIRSTVGLIGLAVLSAFVLTRRARIGWLVTVGLAITGYALGFAADALSIPVLGQLAQGVNVYRLGTVLLPFAIWGALLPLLHPVWSKGAIARLVVWAASFMLLLSSPFWYLGGANTSPWFIAALVVLTASAYLVSRFGTRLTRPFVTGLSVFLVGSLFVFVSAGTGMLAISAPDFRFQKEPLLGQWGDQVRAAVPAGDVIVTSPRNDWMKLITQRAVVADCKDVPYGGEPWREWKERIGDMGGIAQCVAPGPLLFNDLTAPQVIAIADEYDSDFIALDPAVTGTAADLVDLGWEPVVQPVDVYGIVVYERGS
jgi:hypothetical protein